MTEPEKLALTSMDIAEEKREELKRCLGNTFPEVFAEGIIDFEQLRLLLKAGFPLTTKVKRLTLAGKQVFSIEDGALFICLDKEITPELIDALA